MSTVIYDGHSIIADSRACSGNTIDQSPFEKVHMLTKPGQPTATDKLIACGVVGSPYAFNLVKCAILINQKVPVTPFNLYETIKPEKYSFESDFYWSGLFVTADKKVWHLTSECPGFVEVTCNHAIGSGSELAKGALFTGAGGTKAIIAACKLDPYSGLPYSSYDIDHGIFHPLNKHTTG